MKKLTIIIFIMYLFLGQMCIASELSVGMPALNPTEEIDSIFDENKNTNWFVHRIKPTQKNKTKAEIKQKDKKKSELFVQSAKQEPVIKNTQSVKIEKTKEEVIQEKREEEKLRYRELEELTELNRQAVALYTDNNLDDALNTFIKIPEKMRTPEIWTLMGNILMDKGKKDEAVFMYGRAILTEASYYKAYYNLGNVYLSDDKFNMAIEQYKMALKYNPNNPYVHYNLGCAYLKSGSLKKAKYSFIKAVELKNTVADFHYNLAYVYKKLGKEKQAKIYLDNYNKLTGQI